MAGAAPQIEWYIARDGQQYGPLSDPEMRKFVELGHLRPTDLVWRHGFPDWRPAPAVFPTTVPPRPEPPRPAYQPQRQAYPAQARQGQPHQSQTPMSRDVDRARPEVAQAATAPVAVSEAYGHDYGDEDDFDDDFPPEKPRGSLRRLIAVTVLVALLGGALWLTMDLIPSPTKLLALIEAPGGPASQGGDEASSGHGESAQRSQRVEAGGTDQLDADFQQSALWQLLKREFPDWYDERLQEAARLRSEGRDRSEVARRLAEAVVALRRQHAEDALAASPTALKGIAQSFLGNLQHLAEESTQACYGFISQGETSPHVIELMGSPEHDEPLQRQAAAVFRAVLEGRRSPQMHLPPRQTDYQELTQALNNIGWTDREIQLFANPQALASAPPEVVCKLVQDWFTAQLSVSDEDVQLRLLYESLKPVVAG